MKGGHVYIMTNEHHTVLYIGVTSDVQARVIQHKEQSDPKAFTAKYNCTKLVWFEFHESIEEAIDREKRLKGGNRKAKEKLINNLNPDWNDLWEEIKDW